MLNFQALTHLDYRVIPIICSLMLMSLLVISSFSSVNLDASDEILFTPLVKSQMRWFGIGWMIFFLAAAFDYNKLREWTWFLYVMTLGLLVGLFFTGSIVGVNRWYRIPFLNFSVQPSELAKLVVVITLSWFLERRKQKVELMSTVFGAACIVGIPFFLILKQPDLGTALVFFPMTLAMFYFADVNPLCIRLMTCLLASLLIFVALIFLGIIPHESLRPFATKLMKNYQFDRLDPNTLHQRAAATAIAIGGLTGTGWKKSAFTARGWLPAAYTDSVFPALGEEWGFFGLMILLGLYYALIYCSFQAAVVAKDHFGRLLAAGVAVYLAIHILVNVGMMCGFLPITGVPLILITYGGSSIILTMAALGILQSIYCRRFMF